MAQEMTDTEKAILDAERIVQMQALLTGIRNGTVKIPAGMAPKRKPGLSRICWADVNR